MVPKGCSFLVNTRSLLHALREVNVEFGFILSSKIHVCTQRYLYSKPHIVIYILDPNYIYRFIWLQHFSLSVYLIDYAHVRDFIYFPINKVLFEYMILANIRF